MNTKDKYDYIDTLRFLAILFIVFVHFDHECFQYFMGSTVSQFVFSRESAFGWLLYGWTGKYALALLCVISGFLAAYKCSRKGADVSASVISRYLRLMLPVAGANLLFGIWLIALGEKIDILMYLKSSLIPGLTGTNRHLWCISSFLLGNILISVFYDIKNRNPKGFWLLFAVLFAAVIINDPWLFAVLAGCLCFEAADWISNRKIFRYWWLLFIIPIVWWLPRHEENLLIYYRQTLASVIIMITLYCAPVLQRVLALRKFSFLKKYSYSLFVVHGMTLFLLGPTWEFVQRLGIQSFTGIFISLFAITLAIDVLAAVVIYYLFEAVLYNILSRQILLKPEKKEEQEAFKLIA